MIAQNGPQTLSENLPTAPSIRVVENRTKAGWDFLLGWTFAYTVGQVVALIIFVVVDFALKEGYFRVYYSNALPSHLVPVLYAMLIWALYGTVAGSVQWLLLRQRLCHPAR